MEIASLFLIRKVDCHPWCIKLIDLSFDSFILVSRIGNFMPFSVCDFELLNMLIKDDICAH